MNFFSQSFSRIWTLLASVLILLGNSSSAFAHKSSDSYLTLGVGEHGLTGEWHLALRDLEDAIGLDSNDDGVITWGELKQRECALTSYAFSRLNISQCGHRGDLRFKELLVDHHSDGAYAVLRFFVNFASTPELIDVEYQAFFDIDPTHRGLLCWRNRPASTKSGSSAKVSHLTSEEAALELEGWNFAASSASGDRLAIFSPAASKQQFELAHRAGPGQFGTFVQEGISHIWTGYDHLLFLIALLFPAVLQRRIAQWTPQLALSVIVRSVLKTISAFTLAHSVGLALAVFGWISLPSRLVEPAIAASVVLTALNNLKPVLPDRGWLVALSFGFLHGFGFANALTDLGLRGATLAFGLLGFNAGVEIGQAVIVGMFLLPAVWVRELPVYRYRLVPIGSVMIGVMAGVWFLERVCDTKWLPF